MGLFTGTGDFFRGVFGEDDEEKRRRKERERQAAQARAAAKQAEVQKIQSQPEKPKYKSGISGFFERAGDKLEANSPQDIYARGKQGQSGLYQETKGNVAFGQRARDLAVSSGREIAKVPETVYRSIDKGLDETPTNDINKALAEKDLNKRREMIKKITDPRGAWFQLGKTKTLDENMTEEQLIALRDELLKQREETPQWNSGWKRYFYGSEPLQTYQQRGRGLREEFKKGESAGQKLLEEKGGDSGKDASEFVARNAGPVAFALAALGVGGDVIPDPTDLLKAPAKKAAKQVAKEAAESTWDEVVSAGSKSTAQVITEKIAQETDPSIIKQALKVDDEVATQLASDTTSEAVEDTLKSVSIDPDFNISEEVRKKLEDEGITAVKRDRDNAYDASYNNDTITARDQSTLDANINHEIGHHIWQRRLSPEEKSLFKGNGDASKQAVGRAGYSQDDVISEDFSDYINKALTGRFSEVPPEYRDVIAKYAKITDREKELAGVIDDVGNPAYIRKQAREELDLYQKQRGAQSNYLQEASDIRGKDNPLRELQDLGANPGNELDIPAYVRRNGEELITKANARIDEITATLRRMKEVQLRQQLAESIRMYPEYKDELINGFNVAKFADNFDDLPGAEKLIDEMNALKGEIDRVTKLKQQSDRIAEAQAARAAQTSPDPVKVVEGTPPSTSPEVGANNAYRQTTEEILFPEAPEYAGRDGLNLLQKVSPDRIIRERITRPIENMVDRAVAAAQRSKIAPVRGVGRFFTGVNREFGIDPATQSARMAMRGSVEYGKLLRENIADLSKSMTPEQLNKIWANLDPEQAARLDIKGGTLSPDELVLHDKLKNMIDNVTSENLRRGLIDEEQASAGYIKRAYSVYDGNTEGLTKFEDGFRQELLGQYKGRKQVSDQMVETAITDPTYLVGKKTAESNAMWAMQDYGNYLSKSGMTSDTARQGYTQLPDSKVFGDAAGKWVPRNVAEDFTGFQYNNAMVSALSDVLNVYDRWGIRQAKKQILTIFNPAVRLGNQVSNRAIFSSLNGVNPVQFNKVFLEVDNMMKNGDPLYREAVQMGLTGIDITQADFYAKRIAESTGDGNLAKKAVQWTQDSYSNADDKARISAYVIHRRRGYSPEEAARLTQRGFQDYKSVGFFYDMAAKTPIVGNAFVRFVADSIRIAKNAVVDHPLRTGSILALWAAFANGMSIMSGEGRGDTDEQGNDTSSSLKGDNIAEKAFSLVTGSSKGADQKTREDRFGAPKIPFTNISMTTQTPWGEVNAARFMPWYTLNEVNEGMGGIQKYLPISQSPVTFENGKPQINGGGFADPVLGQLFQIGLDKDFRNKSIRDPENTGNLDRDPLSAQDQWRNIARFFGVNNLPLGRETDAVISAATDSPDIYGKTRSVPQAIARSMGIKVETYGDEQVQNQRETEAYFDEQKRIEDELSQMTPEAQAAWRRLTGYDKLREKVPNEFEPGSDRWKKYPVYDFPEDKWKDYSTHPELYETMMNKKIKQARELGKQVQPEFDPRLSEGFRKQLIENKIVAPGDDAELDQRMYSDPEWDYYQNLKKAYNAQFDKNEEYTDELVKHKTADFPEKPDILKQYSAQYGQYTKGKASKPEWNDALTAAKEAYNKQTFDWTNKEREARGLNAIVWDVWNNPTFGFDETPSGFGYGFGFGGGSSTPGVLRVNNMTDVLNPDIKRLDPIQIAEMPQLAQLFARLQAGGGGGRAKPKLGASSTGL
jgi:hypothetical protein